MDTFIWVMFCLFMFNVLVTSSKLYKGYYPKRIPKETDFVALLLNIGLLLWSGILLFA